MLQKIYEKNFSITCNEWWIQGRNHGPKDGDRGVEIREAEGVDGVGIGEEVPTVVAPKTRYRPNGT